MLSGSEAAPIGNRTSCKGVKDVEKALQESIDDCNRLLESSKKPRKKTRFRISRDPVTGRRKTHCDYQLACQGKINLVVIVDTTAAPALYIVGQKHSCSLCSSLKYTQGVQFLFFPIF